MTDNDICYVAVRAAREQNSLDPVMFATAEAVFFDEQKAKMWINNNKVVWEEVINGVPCYCERAIQPTKITK